MKKLKILSSVIACAMSVCFVGSAKTLEFTMDNNNLYMKDNNKMEQIILETAPYTINDRTMVPIRVVSEKLNATVSWDEAANKVTIKKDDNVIVLEIGKDIALVNNSEVKLDVPATEINGRTMVPIRFISESLNYYVYYLEEISKVTITDIPPILKVKDEVYTMDDLISVSVNYGIPLISEENIKLVTDFITKLSLLADECKSHNLPYDKEYIDNTIKICKDKGDEINKNTLIVPEFKILLKNVLASSVIKNHEYIEIDDNKINEFYKKEYVTAKHILFMTIDPETGLALPEEDVRKSEKSAKDILSKLNNKGNFDELMNKYSQDTGLKIAPNGYTFTKGEMLTEFEKSAFSLKEGEISDIVKTPVGFHIIKKEKLAPITDEIKGKIKENIKINEFNSYYNSLLDKNKDNIKLLVDYKTIIELAKK